MCVCVCVLIMAEQKSDSGIHTHTHTHTHTTSSLAIHINGKALVEPTMRVSIVKEEKKTIGLTAETQRGPTSESEEKPSVLGALCGRHIREEGAD